MKVITPDLHTFHIPVMGIGFTVDTPVKVAPLGISSVMSLVDDELMEKMREFYSHKLNLDYQQISPRAEDSRALRITAWLNLINNIVQERFNQIRENFKSDPDFLKYISLLPPGSEALGKYLAISGHPDPDAEYKRWIRDYMKPGSMDVNIMTRIDRTNYRNNEALPASFNDAHAALRGFANSELESSLVLSAGFNPSLYSYIESFPDFFPREDGFLRKKIILKVSDYRSARIQGKFLARKGLWVSEYRIESGLNCGGHAFPTDGYLLGPVMEEFKNSHSLFYDEMWETYHSALVSKMRPAPAEPIRQKLTVQGGVGTSAEHRFLLDYYNVDSVGWGSPFLLVPEVVNIDRETLDLVSKAGVDDLYASNASPMGIPFNNVRGNSKDAERLDMIEKGTPGSVCHKKYLSLNKEYSAKGLCTASREYIKIKRKELEAQEMEPSEFNRAWDKLLEKTCICVGLGTVGLLVNNLDTHKEGKGVSVCPGPNMAYFSGEYSLQEMVGHIYGKLDLLKGVSRPNMFIKELEVYIDYLKGKIEESIRPLSAKQNEYFQNFRDNMMEGINYYVKLFSDTKLNFEEGRDALLQQLEMARNNLTASLVRVSL